MSELQQAERADSSGTVAGNTRETEWLAAMEESAIATRLRLQRAGEIRRRGGPRPASTAGERLRSRFRNLRRHFMFEYYPWYQTDPWRHWDEGGRQPPFDIGSQ